jgi:ABC-type transport system substrate-binding protein
VDIIQVYGDYLKQAKAAGFNFHQEQGSLQYSVCLPGQTLPDKEDFSPTSPWVGDPNDPKSQENARKVRQALNLAVNKQAIIDGLWAGYGELAPYVLYYYPINKGFKQDWKVPAYDPARAKQLLAEAGVPNGFEIKVAGPKQVPDAPDVMEAVALDWEKVGIKVKRTTEEWGTFLGKTRARKTGGTAFVNSGAGPLDAPSLVWQRAAWSKGAFYWIAESPEYDRRIETIFAEMDENKRDAMETELGQMLYDDARLIMLGVKPAVWAVSKKVGDWPTFTSTMFEYNLEYITWTGQ